MFRKLFQREKPFVTVVSGLPRSGTSMMMKMLEAGGIDPIQDGIRTADDDNPKGYYEFERVKALDKGDKAWVTEAQGKTVKVITALLTHLPDGYEYRVLIMRRAIEEVLASQAKMLTHRGEEKKVTDEQMTQLYRKHLQQTEQWLTSKPDFKWMDVNYAQLVKSPQGQVPQINKFLDSKLDESAMLAIVDPNLYRNRK